MVLTYVVDLKTSKTFISSVKVENENKAALKVDQLRKQNKIKGYEMYSAFKLYDQLNIVNRKPVLLRSW